MTTHDFRLTIAFLLLGLQSWVVVARLEGAEPTNDVESAQANAVRAGHSYHGEVFNEGPRQSAVLIPGMGSIEFPTSTKSANAQAFVVQGILQLHGFLYLEAERSFRQAAVEDPELAISYWGMAMANVNNERRARGFIDEAMKRKGGETSAREALYIEALDQLLAKFSDEDKQKDEQSEANKKPLQAGTQKGPDDAEKKERTERFLATMEKIVDEYPEDLEAKAFIALQLWMAESYGMKIPSRHAVNAMLGEIFAKNPMHPAHHYRIHLWDHSRPKNALESAAMCGPASPGIAHMWHMPGHTYSNLKRYTDAAWQQEASARVDHAHMARFRLLPDEIHNFAHNNEWLVRNLILVGRVQDALDLSRDLVSLPQHPRHNTLSERGSYAFGRQRLLQVLSEYGLWEELLREAGGHYLPPTDDDRAQEEWLGWLSVAQFMSGDAKAGGKTLRSLQRRRLALQERLISLREDQAEEEEREEIEEKEEKPAADAAESPEKIKEHLEELRRVIARAAAAAAARRKDLPTLKKQMETAKLDSLIRAQWLADAGELDEAIQLAEQAVKDDEAQVRPLAILVDVLWRKERKDEALERFASLRTVAGHADLATPMLARLEPVVTAAGLSGDWRTPPAPAGDLGERPPLDQLGPIRWQPYTAPSWSAHTADNELVSGEEYEARPRIVIFYLGFGCLHCMEQLHAFAPKIEAFRELGVDLVAISTETVDELQHGIKNYEKQLEIRLLSDGEKQVFKSFRCWDDFENQPLHGTFLIDAKGQVRWQDIGFEPFNDPEFLLKETKRLLDLP